MTSSGSALFGVQCKGTLVPLFGSLNSIIFIQHAAIRILLLTQR